jgi:hypothetical protein
MTRPEAQQAFHIVTAISAALLVILAIIVWIF